MNLPVSPRDYPTLTEREFQYAVFSVLPEGSRLTFKEQAERFGISTTTLHKWRSDPEIKRAQDAARKELYKTLINDATRALSEIVNDENPKARRERLEAAKFIFELTGELNPIHQAGVGNAIQINIVPYKKESETIDVRDGQEIRSVGT